MGLSKLDAPAVGELLRSSELEALCVESHGFNGQSVNLAFNEQLMSPNALAGGRL